MWTQLVFGVLMMQEIPGIPFPNREGQSAWNCDCHHRPDQTVTAGNGPRAYRHGTGANCWPEHPLVLR